MEPPTTAGQAAPLPASLPVVRADRGEWLHKHLAVLVPAISALPSSAITPYYGTPQVRSQCPRADEGRTASFTSCSFPWGYQSQKERALNLNFKMQDFS